MRAHGWEEGGGGGPGKALGPGGLEDSLGMRWGWWSGGRGMDVSLHVCART